MDPQSTKTKESPRFSTLRENLWYYTAPHLDGECWEWGAGRFPDGYGQVGHKDRKGCGVHRVMWEQFNGPIPDGLHVLHTCDNPPCCNPKHLFLGTNLDNVQDKIAKGRVPKGEQNSRSKLTEVQVRQLRQDYQEGMSSSGLSRKYEITRQAAWQIATRKRWRHVV